MKTFCSSVGGNKRGWERFHVEVDYDFFTEAETFRKMSDDDWELYCGVVNCFMPFPVEASYFTNLFDEIEVIKNSDEVSDYTFHNTATSISKILFDNSFRLKRMAREYGQGWMIYYEEGEIMKKGITKVTIRFSGVTKYSTRKLFWNMNPIR